MAISNGLATLDQVKTNLDLTDSVDDVMLELCIESASRQIEQFTERIFTQVSATRIYTPRDSYVVETDDIYTITTLKTSTAADGVFDETWTASDFQTEPLNGISGGILSPITSIRAVGDYLFPLSGGEATVQIVGTFGWDEIPTAITQACILQASRYYKRADSPMGVAGFDAMGVVRLSRIDPDIATLIEPFCKVRMA